MRILFVMDPAEIMLPDKDTSFAFARGALGRGHECLHALIGDLSVSGDPALDAAGQQAVVTVTCRSLTVSDQAPHVTLGAATTIRADDVDVILIRKDPPFDTAYLHLTRILDLVGPKVFVVNDPAGLRDANEKLFALNFVRWMPRTLVTRDRAAILEFVKEVGGRAVLKPLDGAGGSGVVALNAGDKNQRALVDILTQEGREMAMVQHFQPAIEKGDKRVLVLGGKPLGAILRVPQADDIRANIHVGGRVERTELTANELALVEDLGPTLVKHGLYFVGLDLIGGKLIEVNVTSPTGIQELGRLTGTQPENDVVLWLEMEVSARRARLGISS